MIFSKNFNLHLASLLVEQKWLTQEELQKILQQTSETKNLQMLLLEQGVLSKKDLASLIQIIHSVQNQTQVFPTEAQASFSSDLQEPKNAPILFGKYQMIRKIAQGGMGVVYLVQHQTLKQQYALKVIQPSESTDSETILRFQREAKNAAKLKHPGIVQVYDFGVEKGKYYLCMEYIDGETLEQWLQKKRPLRQKVEVIQKILEILHFAHEQGVIHRDLKPANIFMNRQGVPKIGDFGLSKDLSKTQKSQQITQSGEVIGTPTYMPPEQVAGDIQALDRTSDVYAIGVCLYQALTGHCPFEGNTVHELFYKIVSEDPPPLSDWEPKIHRDLEVITLKSLNKLKKRRYSTAKAFAEDLRRFLKGYPIQARPSTPLEKAEKWFKRNKHLVMVVLVLILGISFFWGVQSWNKRNEYKNKFNHSYVLAQNHLQNFQTLTRKNKEKLKVGLEALNELNLALSFFKQEDALKQKKELGIQLIFLGSQLQEFALAEYLLQDIKFLLLKEQFEQYENTIQTKQKEILTQHLEQFEQWIQNFQEGKIVPGEREEFIFEIVQMREPEIYQRLEQILEESLFYFSQPEKRTSLKDLFYETFIEILGRLERADSAHKLYQVLEKIVQGSEENTSLPLHDIQNYLIALAQALGNTRNGEYFERFQKLREKFQHLPIFEATERSLLKLQHPNQWIFLKEERTTTNSLSLEKMEALYQEGIEKAKQNKLQEALLLFNQIIEADSSFTNAYLGRGQIFLALKQHELAVADFQYFVEKVPQMHFGWALLGNAYSQLSQIEQCIQAYEKSLNLQKDDFTRRSFLSDLVRFYLSSLDHHRFAEAKLIFEKIQKYSEPPFFMEFQKQMTAMILKKITSYEKENRPELRLDLLKYVLDIHPETPLRPKFLDLLWKRSQQKIQQKQWSEARNDLEEYLRYAPPSPHPDLAKIQSLLQFLDEQIAQSK